MRCPKRQRANKDTSDRTCLAWRGPRAACLGNAGLLGHPLSISNASAEMRRSLTLAFRSSSQRRVATTRRTMRRSLQAAKPHISRPT
eukprot:5386330-Prymnesium_polylepis.1